MDAQLATLADLIPMAVTVAAIVIVAAEWIALAGLGRVARSREGWVNIACGAASFLPVFALSLVVTLGLMFGLYEWRLFDLGLDWWVWVLAYVAYDFMSFVVHFLSHKVRLLWCMHSVHHAAEEMKASVSFRGSIGDFLVTPHTTLWLPLLGFHPLMVVIVEGVGLLWGVLLHLSDEYMPEGEPTWLRRVLITPAIHRLHHGRNAEYIDTNYGLTFAIWDRVFGTWQAPVEGVELEYGVTTDVDASRFVESQTHEFKALWADVKGATRWVDKVGYVLRAPGWTPAVRADRVAVGRGVVRGDG